MYKLLYNFLTQSTLIQLVKVQLKSYKKNET